MKGIFLTDAPADTLNKIYNGKIREMLYSEIDIEPDIITREMLEKNKTAYTDTDVIFTSWGMPRLSESEIKTVFPSLKAVFYAAGSVQSFACPFLALGIRVFSAWGANAVPVAEYTVSQIILANKGFFRVSRIKSPDEYYKNRAVFAGYPGSYGAKVGLVGCGMIARRVIELLKAYNLSVMVYDRFMTDGELKKAGVEKASLEEIFSSCQIISNHLADNEETKGIYTYDLFRRMKNNAVFINTGRGRQVVENDLIRAMREQPERVAVLDVTYPEPPSKDSEFYSLDNIIITPHIAGSSGDELARMGEYMYDEFISFKNGKPLKYEITKKMLETMA